MLQIERWAALETGKCFGEDLWEKDGFKRNQDPWETLLEGRIFLLFLLVGEAIKKIYQKEKKISLWIRLNLEHYLIFEVIDHNFFFFFNQPLWSRLAKLQCIYFKLYVWYTLIFHPGMFSRWHLEDIVMIYLRKLLAHLHSGRKLCQTASLS